MSDQITVEYVDTSKIFHNMEHTNITIRIYYRDIFCIQKIFLFQKSKDGKCHFMDGFKIRDLELPTQFIKNYKENKIEYSEIEHKYQSNWIDCVAIYDNDPLVDTGNNNLNLCVTKDLVIIDSVSLKRTKELDDQLIDCFEHIEKLTTK